MKSELDAILRDLPTLREVLEAAKRKYVSLSRISGTVPLEPEAATDAYRLGCRIPKNRRLPLKELDRAFRESRLGTGLVEVLEAMHGGPIETRQDEADWRERRWTELSERLVAAAGGPEGRSRVEAWIRADEQYLRMEAFRLDEEFERAALGVAAALGQLPGAGNPVPLAYFATTVVGHAHALDAEELGGRLFDRALQVVLPGWTEVAALSRGERESLLAAADIITDDLSSDVLTVGLTGDLAILRGALSEWQPLRLTLYNIHRSEGIAPAHGDTVFAVENPTVFRMLMEQLRSSPADRRPALVCTNGHLSRAAERLIGRFAERGVSVRYSGDFDLQGVEIALRLRDRHPACVSLWRMDASDHRAALAKGQAGSGPPRAALDRLATRSPEHARMLASGTAHHEAIVDRLWRDLAATESM